MKKWYQVSFFAKMDENDIKAMKNHFFVTMEEDMQIPECEGLQIDEDTDPEYEADDYIVELEKGDYDIDEYGILRIDTSVFDAFAEYGTLEVHFIDEDNKISHYEMLSEDENYIYCTFIK